MTGTPKTPGEPAVSRRAQPAHETAQTVGAPAPQLAPERRPGAAGVGAPTAGLTRVRHTGRSAHLSRACNASGR